MYTCILLWSFRQSAWKQQIRDVVCLDLSYEDPFVPQTQIIYHGSTVKASLLWSIVLLHSSIHSSVDSEIGCCIQDGFFIKSTMKRLE